MEWFRSILTTKRSALTNNYYLFFDHKVIDYSLDASHSPCEFDGMFSRI
jgi:hypothetical protein